MLALNALAATSITLSSISLIASLSTVVAIMCLLAASFASRMATLILSLFGSVLTSIAIYRSELGGLYKWKIVDVVIVYVVLPLLLTAFVLLIRSKSGEVDDARRRLLVFGLPVLLVVLGAIAIQTFGVKCLADPGCAL